MRYCWSCKPGLLFATSGETLSFWLGGCPTYWLLQLKGPREMSGWHLSGGAEGAGGDTDVAKSLVWREKKATSLPLPCGRCSGLAAPWDFCAICSQVYKHRAVFSGTSRRIKTGQIVGIPQPGLAGSA